MLASSLGSGVLISHTVDPINSIWDSSEPTSGQSRGGKSLVLAPTALLPVPLTPSNRLCRASLKLHGANLTSSASLAAPQINFSLLGSLGILIFWYHSHIVTLYPCLSWGRSGFVSCYSAQERKARPAVFLIYRYHVLCEACEPDLSHPKTLRARDLVLVEAIFSLTSSLFITAVSSDGFGSSSVAV